MTYSVDIIFKGMTYSVDSVFKGMTYSVDSDFKGMTYSVDSVFKGMTYSVDSDFKGMTYSVDSAFKGMTYSVAGHSKGMIYSVAIDARMLRTAAPCHQVAYINFMASPLMCACHTCTSIFAVRRCEPTAAHLARKSHTYCLFVCKCNTQVIHSICFVCTCKT